MDNILSLEELLALGKEVMGWEYFQVTDSSKFYARGFRGVIEDIEIKVKEILCQPRVSSLQYLHPAGGEGIRRFRKLHSNFKTTIRSTSCFYTFAASLKEIELGTYKEENSHHDRIKKFYLSLDRRSSQSCIPHERTVPFSMTGNTEERLQQALAYARSLLS